MKDNAKASNYKIFKHAKNAILWQAKGTVQPSPFFYTCGMGIDFDGAPDAYAVPGQGKIGRDNLDNAIPLADKAGRPPRSPGWIPTYQSTVRDPRTGASIARTSGPGAGYYISESSLKDIFHAAAFGGVSTDPAYQTDANTYPYLALPLDFLKDSRLQVGDFAMAIHGVTGAHSFAVFGDTKNKHIVGECSSALAKALGLPSARNGGATKNIVYVVFPGSGLGPKMRCELSELDRSGMRWLELYDNKLDLVKKVTDCFDPELPGVRLAFRDLGFTV